MPHDEQGNPTNYEHTEWENDTSDRTTLKWGFSIIGLIIVIMTLAVLIVRYAIP